MARPETIKTALGKRLRSVREAKGDPTRAEFSERLGFSAASLGNYERGDTQPDAAALVAYREVWSVNLEWLLTGAGEMFHERKPLGVASPLRDPTEAVRRSALPDISGIGSNDQMVTIPMYEEITAAAGSGDMPHGEIPTRMIAFNAQFLRDHGATPSACSIITAKGESMYPAIPDGAMLVVDHSQIAVEHGFIYVFNIGEMVVVKRASWSLSQKLTLKSDNPAHNYPDDTFSKEDADALNVVGRVIFYGRKA